VEDIEIDGKFLFIKGVKETGRRSLLSSDLGPGKLGALLNTTRKFQFPKMRENFMKTAFYSRSVLCGISLVFHPLDLNHVYFLNVDINLIISNRASQATRVRFSLLAPEFYI